MNDYAVSNAFYGHLIHMREEEALEMIKEYGIRPVDYGYDARQPIFEAVAYNCLRVVRAFLDMDPKCVGKRNEHWRSILFAVNTVEMVKLLGPYREYIDCKRTNHRGHTAAQYQYISCWRWEVARQLMASFPAMPLMQDNRAFYRNMWYLYVRMAMIERVSTDVVRHFF
jgi:hypothetical protein